MLRISGTCAWDRRAVGRRGVSTNKMAAAQLVLLAAVLVLFGSRAAKCACNTTAFATQLDTLLAEYDRETAPATPIQIKAALDVRHAAVYDRSATVRLLADLHLNWEDKRITWNATEWGCDSALSAADRLWLPDVGVLSVATLGAEGDTDLRARLSSAGRVSRIVRLDLAAPVSLQLADWPHDQQEVLFKFGSRAHSSDEIQTTMSDLKHATVFESGGWELVRVRGAESLWDGGGVQRRVVTWSVALRRRAAAHELAAGAVLSAGAALLLAAVLLPPNSRPPLCAASAVTTSLWLVAALGRAPGAATVPHALALAGAICACAAAAAVGAALVRRVAQCSWPPPRALRTLVTAASAVVKLTPPEASGAESSAWAAAAQLLDYLLLAVLLFIVFVVICVHV